MAIKYLSALDAARQIGCNKSTVIRRAKRLGIGATIIGRLAFTASDVAKLAKAIQAGPGNPNFTPGNHFGGSPKKARK